MSRGHRPGTKTLAVFNTVRRAVEVYQGLSKRPDVSEVVLIHSRFRLEDRKANLEVLLEKDREVIAVTTQVVEAGVDVSATTLLTELAPWSSLVQRFGRCNRKGDDEGAQVIWFDPGEIDGRLKEADPYSVDDLRRAREVMVQCKNVSLEALEEIKADMPLDPVHVIRRRDLIDLFDTTPDLAGSDIDVSRFIRSGDEHDVKVYWREFEGRPEEEKPPSREELCSVPFLALREFRDQKKGEVWRWDGLEGAWRKVEEREIYPGQTYLVRAGAGGYDSEVGWNAKSGQVETLLPSGEEENESYPRDYEDGRWLSIAERSPFR